MAWVKEVMEGEKMQSLKRRKGGLVRSLEIFFGKKITCYARARAMRVHRSVLRNKDQGVARASGECVGWSYAGRVG